jgi:hypothetical protein
VATSKDSEHVTACPFVLPETPLPGAKQTGAAPSQSTEEPGA